MQVPEIPWASCAVGANGLLKGDDYGFNASQMALAGSMPVGPVMESFQVLPVQRNGWYKDWDRPIDLTIWLFEITVDEFT